MARLTKEERDDLLARLADDHDDDPDPDTDTDTEEATDDTDTDTDTDDSDTTDTDDAVAIDDGSGDVMIVRGAAATRLLDQYFGTPTTPTRARPAKATAASKQTPATKKRAPRTQPDPTPVRSGPRYFR